MSDLEKKDSESQAESQAEKDSPGKAIPRWRSEQILEGSPEAIIEHNNEIYRLRRTRNNRLILYK